MTDLSELDSLLEELEGSLGSGPARAGSKEGSCAGSSRAGVTEAGTASSSAMTSDHPSTEDIDDLLREFSSVSTTTSKLAPKPATVNVSMHAKTTNPLGPSNSRLPPTPTTTPVHSIKGKGAKERCKVVVLGGSGMPRGLTSGFDEHSCNRVRCTQCDFKVAEFRDMRWAPDVDYMFLRNTVPDEVKLRTKLMPQPGTVAMCCQCTWESVREPVRITLASKLRWVCGGHLAAEGL